MKKSLVAILALILALSMATFAFAQNNKLAFFDIDADLSTAGFQGGKVVEGMGGGKRVGFALYMKNVDELRGYTLDFTWDGAKAEMASETGTMVDIDDRNVNGVDVILSEDNVLGEVSGIVTVDEDGHYAEDFAKLGGDALASEEYGLIYCFVLKTASDFTTDDSFTITVKVNALNNDGIVKDCGQREFYVNGSVDVKTSTWGEIKSQFKD